MNISEAKQLLTRQTVGGIVTGGECCTLTWEQAQAIKGLLEPSTECEIEHRWRNASDDELEAFLDDNEADPEEMDSFAFIFWGLDNNLFSAEEVARIAQKHSISVDKLM